MWGGGGCGWPAPARPAMYVACSTRGGTRLSHQSFFFFYLMMLGAPGDLVSLAPVAHGRRRPDPRVRNGPGGVIQFEIHTGHSSIGYFARDTS